MITKATTFGGVCLVLIGLLGFAAPEFLGMHLSALHNLLHLLSGAAAIYFGLNATPATARTFCVVFGAVYALLGGVALLVGEGSGNTFTVIPGALVFGTMDHLVHLILGAIFLSVGWGWRAATVTPGAR